MELNIMYGFWKLQLDRKVRTILKKTQFLSKIQFYRHQEHYTNYNVFSNVPFLFLYYDCYLSVGGYYFSVIKVLFQQRFSWVLKTGKSDWGWNPDGRKQLEPFCLHLHWIVTHFFVIESSRGRAFAYTIFQRLHIL